MTTITYSIIPVKPEAHLFQVCCEIIQPSLEGQTLSLPAWIPGSYMIRDFAKNIVWLKASCHGQMVECEKIDKDSWYVSPSEGTLTIDYQVYAWDLSVRSAHLDTTHGFFNGTSVFIRVHGYESQACSINIQPPQGQQYQQWRIATSLQPVASQPIGQFGDFIAANYDELIDHPVEMGTFDWLEFSACEVPHYVAITGQHRCDQPRLIRDLTQICEYHIRFFGEPAPMDRYVFLITVVGEGYGGLEHRNSTALLCSRNSLPLLGREDINNDYRELLGLCSHEYFHTWNIKRIKPAVFIPYDLQKENYTRLLWAFEGITSYYDDLALMRCGLISLESYLQLLGKTMTHVLRGAGRHIQTVSESSFDAWTKFYKQDENATNAIVSYYSKGTLVALSLDLLLRQLSGQTCALDHVMRLLWERYGNANFENLPTGVPETGVEEIAMEIMPNEVARQQLKIFFDQALRTTDDLPLNELLATIGIQVNLRTADSQTDTGGTPSKIAGLDTINHEPSALGIRVRSNQGYPEIVTVYSNYAAQQAGLAVGDVLIAINGLKVTMQNFERQISGFKSGENIEIHLFRRDELMAFVVNLQSAIQDTCYLTTMEDADNLIQSAHHDWKLGALT